MEQLVLIDGNSLINRAFYAMTMLSNKDGIFTNAVYGFCNMLIKIILDNNPKYLAVCFDVKAPTFRHEMYKEYKAGRKGMPDELAAQLPLLKDILKKMNIKTLEQAGVEADDILGTLSKRFPSCKVIVVTGDRDCLQLVDDNVNVWLTKKGLSEILEVTHENIKENFGVNANQIVELKSLMGDASDNIPGALGIGEITAKKLIDEYQSVENLYLNIENVAKKTKEKLVNSAEIVALSRKLATINTECDIPCEIEELTYDFPFPNAVFESFQNLQFYSIIKRGELFSNVVNNIDVSEKITVNTKEALEELFLKIENTKFSLYIDNNIHIGVSDKLQYTIVLMENFIEGGFDPTEMLCSLFEKISKKHNVIVFDYKDMHKKYLKFGCDLGGCFDDVALLSYVLGYSGISDVHVLLQKCGYGEENIAASMFGVYNFLIDKLQDQDSERIYKAELKVCEILRDMEDCGIKVDLDVLEKLDVQTSAKIQELTSKIYEIVGEKFNINSPMQLGNMLFEKLGLKSEKKTKRGYGTDNEVLENLISKHEIIGYIIEYRQVAKLKSTYIDGMRNVISSDGKVHTEFKQYLTYTGRLSSTEPNLQNIPKATPLGREMRKMFVASTPGNMLVSADYSQIELRLLAHLSQDKQLIKAFSEGDDIHSNTAMHIFNVPKSLVTPSMRRQAKAINFGIIYGKSEFSLSKELGMSRASAKKFIDDYFAAYPSVKDFLKDVIHRAKETGLVTTMFGRVRKIPEIKSSNYAVRSHAERAATNMPLQGSAADIIKLAMCDVQESMKKNKLVSKLILQVHDELIVDAVISEVETVKEILRAQMENVVKLRVPLDVNVSSSYDWFEV